MATIEKADVVKLLADIALCLDLLGENRFKISAHQKGVRALEQYEGDLTTLQETDGLTSLTGIGKGIAEKIEEALRTGDIAERHQLRARLPEGLFEILKVEGLGPKKVKALYEKLGIGSLGELEYACNENRLLSLDGFGQKSQEKIVAALQQLRHYKNKVLLPEALGAAEELATLLQRHPAVSNVSLAGEVAEHEAVIASLDFLTTTSDGAAVIKHFREGVEGLLIHKTDGATCLEGQLSSGLSLTLTLAKESVPSEQPDPLADEKNLVTEKNITGLFHCHTTYSDGRNTLKEMADAARSLGHHYLGISDHSRSAHYAGGLSIDDLQKQSDEIDQLNATYDDFHIFKGVESDILADGSLDYPDNVLDQLDFVIASVHSGFKKKSAEMTTRIIRAIEHPATTMLGHMTGRLLLAREGYPLDIARIIEASAKQNVIIELNANPQRLDIDWRHIKAARDAGVTISINPDAHRVVGLSHLRWGIIAARKGGATAADIFNTRPIKDIAAYLAHRHA